MLQKIIFIFNISLLLFIIVTKPLKVVAISNTTNNELGYTENENYWNYINDNYYLSSVKNTPWGLIIGEYDSRAWLNPFNGLYISTDNAVTFKELALKDKGITDIYIDDNDNLYATTYYHTNTPAGLFISKDKGTTFVHIGPEYSSNIIKKINDTLYLGTYAHGLFISLDNGVTWEQKIENIFIKDIDILDDDIYIYGYKDTYKSTNSTLNFEKIDYINTTQTININDIFNVTATNKDVYINELPTKLNKLAIDIDYNYDGNYNIYSIVNGYGLYKYTIPKNNKIHENTFSIPFDYHDKNELLDKITAYFDHEYPLLGSILSEEQNTSDTTLNFLGTKDSVPNLYYSSHNGTDYALNYGSNVYAVAPGIASYFWCYSCGHSIKIVHDNGYESIYMHLTEDIQIPKDKQTNVITNQLIGYVGMSGNTTGPHLHFLVKKDGIVIDPYGWQHDYFKDPWITFDKNNIKGSESVYLWKHNIFLDSIKTIDEYENKEIYSIDNLALEIDMLNKEQEYLPFIKKYIKPKTNEQENLSYIKNTSSIISLYNTKGLKIDKTNDFVKINFKIDPLLFTKNISLWHFNSTFNIWELIDTFFNYEKNEIFAYTNNFSKFAVFENTYIDLNNFYDKLPITSVTFNIGFWQHET